MNYEQLINKLAERLAVPAAQLWAVLVRQARIEALMSLYYVAIFAAVLIAYRRIRPRIVAWENAGGDYYSNDRDMGRILYDVFGIISSTISGILAICMVGQAIAYLFNPDYYALQQILSAVK